MAKGKKTCAECQTQFNLRDECCPECGAEYFSVFHDGGDVIIHDVKGEEIAIGVEIHSGYRLRIQGKPPTYHPNYAMVLKEIRHSRVAIKSSTIKSIEELIKLESEANDFIKSLKDKEQMIKE